VVTGPIHNVRVHVKLVCTCVHIYILFALDKMLSPVKTPTQLYKIIRKSAYTIIIIVPKNERTMSDYGVSEATQMPAYKAVNV
jgi:hypothetical protein